MVTGVCFVLVSFYTFLFLAMCARLSLPQSAFESTLNSSIVSYRIVSYSYNQSINQSTCATQFVNMPYSRKDLIMSLRQAFETFWKKIL